MSWPSGRTPWCAVSHPSLTRAPIDAGARAVRGRTGTARRAQWACAHTARRLAAEALRRRAVLALLHVAHAHDARVDGAAHAVEQLHVELREEVGLVDRRLAEIALRRRIHDV